MNEKQTNDIAEILGGEAWNSGGSVWLVVIIEFAGEASSDIIISSRKREIRNILKSYVGFYDPFCELIQNALDAVDMRAYQESESYQKHVWIKIDLVANSISVTDNGIGFGEEKFKLFLSPSISFKSEASVRLQQK